MNTRKFIYKISFLSLLIFTLISLFNFSTKALSYSDISREELNEIIKDCPENIKFNLNKEYDDFEKSGKKTTYFLDGTIVNVVYDEQGKPTYQSECNSFADLEKIVIRLYGFIISIIGGVFSFGAGKAAFMMTWNDEESDSFEEGTKGLKRSIGYLISYFFVYILITFILTGILGVGTSKKNEWNIICQNRIIFDITFGDGATGC